MHREPHPYARGELAVVIDCSDLGLSAEFWPGAPCQDVFAVQPGGGSRR